MLEYELFPKIFLPVEMTYYFKIDNIEMKYFYKDFG